MEFSPLVNLAVTHIDDPIGVRSDVGGVGDHDNRHATGPQFIEQAKNRAVAVESRLPVGSSASSSFGSLARLGDRDPLSLTSRQFGRSSILTATEVDIRQKCAGAKSALVC